LMSKVEKPKKSTFTLKKAFMEDRRKSLENVKRSHEAAWGGLLEDRPGSSEEKELFGDASVYRGAIKKEEKVAGSAVQERSSGAGRNKRVGGKIATAEGKAKGKKFPSKLRSRKTARVGGAQKKRGQKMRSRKWRGGGGKKTKRRQGWGTLNTGY